MVKPTQVDIKALKKDRKATIIRGLDLMNDEERYDIISRYCKSCGSKNTSCQCWNDD